MKKIKSIMWFTGSLICLVIETVLVIIAAAFIAGGRLLNVFANLICEIKPKLHPTIERCNHD